MIIEHIIEKPLACSAVTHAAFMMLMHAGSQLASVLKFFYVKYMYKGLGTSLLFVAG